MFLCDSMVFVGLFGLQMMMSFVVLVILLWSLLRLGVQLCFLLREKFFILQFIEWVIFQICRQLGIMMMILFLGLRCVYVCRKFDFVELLVMSMLLVVVFGQYCVMVLCSVGLLLVQLQFRCMLRILLSFFCESSLCIVQGCMLFLVRLMLILFLQRD